MDLFPCHIPPVLRDLVSEYAWPWPQELSQREKECVLFLSVMCNHNGDDDDAAWRACLLLVDDVQRRALLTRKGVVARKILCSRSFLKLTQSSSLLLIERLRAVPPLNSYGAAEVVRDECAKLLRARDPLPSTSTQARIGKICSLVALYCRDDSARLSCLLAGARVLSTAQINGFDWAQWRPARNRSVAANLAMKIALVLMPVAAVVWTWWRQ